MAGHILLSRLDDSTEDRAIVIGSSIPVDGGSVPMDGGILLVGLKCTQQICRRHNPPPQLCTQNPKSIKGHLPIVYRCTQQGAQVFDLKQSSPSQSPSMGPLHGLLQAQHNA